MNRAVSLTEPVSSARYPALLLGLYVIAWIGLAIAPLYRHDWMLENVLPLIAVALLVSTYRWRRFSNFTYTMLFLFMLLHAVGAHYTYAKVPYDEWLHAVSGQRLGDWFGWRRNHFDRLVHFLYGAMLFPLCWELFCRHINGRAWQYLLIGAFLMSHAGIYEAIEWLAAEFFGGDLGVAYLGTQGDQWDAQKDMALALLGTLLAMLITALAGHRDQPPRRSTRPS